MAEKKRHPVRNTAAGVGVVALLAMLLGGRFGLGRGGTGGEGLLPAENSPPTAPAAETTQAPEETAEKDDGVLTVTVREDGFLYEGRDVTLAELEAALLSDWKDGTAVELVDDHAVKGSYDEAAAVLQRLAIDYTER